MELYIIIEKILHTMITVLIFIGCGVWLYWAVLNKKRWRYAIAPILFFLHRLLVIILGSLDVLPFHIYEIWLELTIIHAFLVIISGGIIMINFIKD